MMPQPSFDLKEPGTVQFTAERAFDGRHLTAFCLSLRVASNRASYLTDPDAYMQRYALTAADRDLVRARDWTALLRRGAHLQAVLKLCATHGGNLFDIGAHNAGVSVTELLAACPRLVSAVPGKA